MSLHTLIIDGAAAAYRTWGDAETPLLCLHGNPTSSYLWRHLGEGLKERSRVIAPDLPGHGDSELGSRAGTWEEMVQFVERFAVALDVRQFDLALHDWGGLIGFRWLFDYPSRLRNLRRLVIGNTGFFYTDSSAWHSLAKIWRTPGEGEAWMDAVTFEAFRDTLRAVSPGLPDDAVAEYWKTLSTPERRMARLALYRSGDFEKIKPYDGMLATISSPTLIVWGESDPFIPSAAAHIFKQEIPDARLHMLHDASHFLWEDAPGEILRLVREFLLEDR
ncbi:MAG: alpha/beta hydrolase [Candidatus Abyssubacteria bacterium]